jgi:hypothetical protein
MKLNMLERDMQIVKIEQLATKQDNNNVLADWKHPWADRVV